MHDCRTTAVVRAGVRGRRVAVLAFLGLGMCGAHPAPEGTESHVGIGVSRVEYTTSAATVYRYHTTGYALHLQGRHRFDGGVTVAGQLNADGGLVTGFRQMTPAGPDHYTPPGQVVGDPSIHGAGAVRGGWHGDWFGGELGLAVYSLPTSQRHASPSALAWVGSPSLAYVWGQWFSGPLASSKVLTEPMVGIGHQSKWVALWGGAHVGSRVEVRPAEPEAPVTPVARTFLVGSQLTVAPGVRLGAEFARGNAPGAHYAPDSRVLMVITVEDQGRQAAW